MMYSFVDRHNGLKPAEEKEMLKTLGLQSMEELTEEALPDSIKSQFENSEIFDSLTEAELLDTAEKLASKNQTMQSVIGQGYYNTLSPSPILRNIFENPAWYTAYTPYQAEISQGRLEALINFQTMVCDLTGMEISNSSLLDEGTALAEALTMSLNISRIKSEEKVALYQEDLFKQSLTLLKTRALTLGVQLVSFKSKDDLNSKLEEFKGKAFCLITQSPSALGDCLNLKEIFKQAQQKGLLCIASTDLMSCLTQKSPGSQGADIVVGNSQRFGVPMGFGGPHAAFLATKEKHKRLIPGRIIGVSKDSDGKMAYRLSLQTREQHIRREKATSNICTAQVLLAVMASMYAVYHGPKNLRAISKRINATCLYLKKLLQANNYKVLTESPYDTLTVASSSAEARQSFLAQGINIRIDSENQWGFSVDESWSLENTKNFCSVLGLNFKAKEWEAAEAFCNREQDYLSHPNFNSYHTETELARYIKSLESKDYSLVHGMIPLGSCTMKLNAATEMKALAFKGFSNLHPFAPKEQTLGYQELISELNDYLCKLTGFSRFSFQPNSGAQGEYAGLLTLRRYLDAQKQEQRKICLVPSSAHGTNPASAVMAGFKVVIVQSDDNGNIDIEDLKTKIETHKETLGALMVTYPSTHGVYEEEIKEITSLVHQAGGLVYMDGANMNAMVALSKSTDLGMDVSHLNLHKTFCIPHGGGGPGVGPIGVVDKLIPYLPEDPLEGSFSVASAEYGSASILPISWAYIRMMGFEGLKKATATALLNANYIAKKLSPYYPVLYTGKGGFVAHECILDTRVFKEVGVTVDDIAKRLIDYGFHAPTMSWPVVGTLMIEPTESESKKELDRFCEAMIAISEEIKEIQDGKFKVEESPLRNAPHSLEKVTSDEWAFSYSRQKAAYPLESLKRGKFFASVGRVDNAYGDRNLFCTCPPLDSFES